MPDVVGMTQPEAEAAHQGDHGHTMVYSSAGRVQEDLHDVRTARVGRPAMSLRMSLILSGRRQKPTFTRNTQPIVCESPPTAIL